MLSAQKVAKSQLGVFLAGAFGLPVLFYRDPEHQMQGSP
jgi:hypothetical protein